MYVCMYVCVYVQYEHMYLYVRMDKHAYIDININIDRIYDLVSFTLLRQGRLDLCTCVFTSAYAV